MTLVCLWILSIYALFMCAVLLQWVRIPRHIPANPKPEQRFAVIIPFRNEEANIPDVFNSIEKLNFPKDQVEFIWVNDHSTDKGADWLTSQSPMFSHRVMHLESETGKKPALYEGIQHSNAEFIITLDCDCLVHPEWLRVYSSAFAKSCAMVIGNVVISPDNTWSGRFQQVEQMALTGITGVMAAWNVASMCNGANLGFRKDDFLSLEGYNGNTHIPSGDDQFLLKKFRDARLPIGYINSPQHAVTTAPVPGWQALLAQRRRWAGKWKTGGWPNVLLALLVALSSVSVLILWGVAIVAGNLWLPLTVTGVKIGVDVLLVYLVSQRLDVPIRGIHWPLLGIAYPFYGTYMAIRANVGQYEWKGRRYTTG